jgi:hypothetical protein
MKNISQPEPDKTIEPEYDRAVAESCKNIPGWGVDADPENMPNYPMKHWNGADYERYNYEKPSQQPITVEVLHSTERPGVSRVFGTSMPPSGLSGMIRRFAFRYNESTYLHWVPLILADRINVIEGYIDDLKHGIIPNPVKLHGWTAEWKYNKKGVLKAAAVTAVAIGFIAGFLAVRKRRMNGAKILGHIG